MQRGWGDDESGDGVMMKALTLIVVWWWGHLLHYWRRRWAFFLVWLHLDGGGGDRSETRETRKTIR